MIASAARNLVFSVFRKAWVEEALLPSQNVRYPNLRKDNFPVTGGASAEVFLTHTDSEQSTLPGGNSGKIKYKTTALFEAVIYLDREEGNDDVYSIGEKIIKAFRNSSTNGVWFRNSFIKELDPDGNFNRVSFLSFCDYYHVDQPAEVPPVNSYPNDQYSVFLPFDDVDENLEQYSWYGETYVGTGKHDGAFVFDHEAVLSVPVPTIDPNAYSVVFWINATGVRFIGELDAKVIWRGDINNLSDPVPHYIFNTSKDFYSGDVCYHDSSFPLHSEVTSDLLDETWRHVAITYDGARKSFYLDGVLRHTAVASPAPVANDTLNFGGVPGYYYKNGSLDDVGYFSRTALTQEQIYEIYSSPGPLGTPP